MIWMMIDRSHLLRVLARRQGDGHLLLWPDFHGPLGPWLRFGLSAEEVQEAQGPRLLLWPLHGVGLEQEQQLRRAGQRP